MAQKGSKNHRAKLTEDQVKQIRDDYQKYIDNRPGAILKRYGIHASTLEKILKRQLWRHVD